MEEKLSDLSTKEAKCTIWLIDAENQSPRLAAQAANLLGWPDMAILAGRPEALARWTSGAADFPATVSINTWPSPPIPDGADVLLAIAVGSVIGELGKAVIFSRDNLVAGTLGQLLVHRGVSVLAVSATTHTGLAYPHLTLPVIDAQPKNTETKETVPKNKEEPEIPAQQVKSPVFYSDITALGDDGNLIVAQCFKDMGNPESLFKSHLGAYLTAQGIPTERRMKIYKSMDLYEVHGVHAEVKLIR